MCVKNIANRTNFGRMVVIWILGAKGWKSGASLFAGGFLNLGPGIMQ